MANHILDLNFNPVDPWFWPGYWPGEGAGGSLLRWRGAKRSGKKKAWDFFEISCCSFFLFSREGFCWEYRQTQSILYFPSLVNRFQRLQPLDFKSVLRIVQYNYSKSCTNDLMLQDLVLCTRLCGTDFILQHCWVVDFQVINMIKLNIFVPARYQLPKGTSFVLALCIFESPITCWLAPLPKVLYS